MGSLAFQSLIGFIKKSCKLFRLFSFSSLQNRERRYETSSSELEVSIPHRVISKLQSLIDFIVLSFLKKRKKGNYNLLNFQFPLRIKQSIFPTYEESDSDCWGNRSSSSCIYSFLTVSVFSSRRSSSISSEALISFEDIYGVGSKSSSCLGYFFNHFHASIWVYKWCLFLRKVTP